ncbi:MAG: tRNA (adenosine(37)-N6)-threonylcarbamoyltransferase complex ATPase subunit type 1 TsaE [Treponema sp.]|jgi:tRNA threonylcarbamoyladenosine biosynthesis protein TsaE|nr:tRNA (adenosine(37)-N6)-threonylcarbamoyltransferase complex ATPase subunit type 1 TsaE [Treponema sp.]
MERCLTERRSSSPEETEALGQGIARCLKPGAVIALQGGLGAGKTCLARGIARGLGIAESVTSPTYMIISEYPGIIPMYHIDAYRLSSDDDFDSTGAGEYIGAEGVTVIEWPERIPRSIPPDAITIQIEITGPHSRTFRIEGIEP